MKAKDTKYDQIVEALIALSNRYQELGGLSGEEYEEVLRLYLELRPYLPDT